MRIVIDLASGVIVWAADEPPPVYISTTPEAELRFLGFTPEGHMLVDDAPITRPADAVIGGTWLDGALALPPVPAVKRTRLWFWDALAVALAEEGAPPNEDARDALWMHPALWRVIKRAEIGDVVDPADVFARREDLIAAGIVPAAAFDRLAALWVEG